MAEQARRREELGRFLGDMRTPGRLLGTKLARKAHARELELALATMDDTGRSSSRNVNGIRTAQSTTKGQKHCCWGGGGGGRREGGHRGPQQSLVPLAGILTRPRGDEEARDEARGNGRNGR